jgi:hypothetical protein
MYTCLLFSFWCNVNIKHWYIMAFLLCMFTASWSFFVRLICFKIFLNVWHQKLALLLFHNWWFLWYIYYLQLDNPYLFCRWSWVAALVLRSTSFVLFCWSSSLLSLLSSDKLLNLFFVSSGFCDQYSLTLVCFLAFLTSRDRKKIE